MLIVKQFEQIINKKIYHSWYWEKSYVFFSDLNIEKGEFVFANSFCRKREQISFNIILVKREHVIRSLRHVLNRTLWLFLLKKVSVSYDIETTAKRLKFNDDIAATMHFASNSKFILFFVLNASHEQIKWNRLIENL